MCNELSSLSRVYIGSKRCGAFEDAVLIRARTYCRNRNTRLLSISDILGMHSVVILHIGARWLQVLAVPWSAVARLTTRATEQNPMQICREHSYHADRTLAREILTRRLTTCVIRVQADRFAWIVSLCVSENSRRR